jgi:hypothetical protein
LRNCLLLSPALFFFCRGYFGFEQGDTSLRADLYKHREREKREAEKRAEMERDELAKLGTSRKK